MVNRESIQVSDGVQLSFITNGSGDGDPTFLLVHGLASNARTWDGVAELLAGAGCQALAVDQRGHGESSRPSHGYDFATITTDLAKLIENRIGGPVVIAGQSWGGNVAIEFAKRHPHLCSAVVCVDGGFIRIADQFPSWEEAARELAPPDLSNFTLADLNDLRARFGGWPETGVAGQLANFEQIGPDSVRPRLSRDNHMLILSALWNHDPHSVAAELRPPVLVLAVGHDDEAKRKRVAAFADELMMGALVWIEGDHDIHAQRPDLVARSMLDFVAEVM